MFESGRAPATAALAVAAVRFRAKLAGQPDPAGEATARVLGGYRRTAADQGLGQAAPLRADGLAAILATAERPRTDGRGVESTTTAQRRGRTDAVIAGENVTTAIRADLKEFKADINARVDGVAGSIQSLQREIASLRWMIGVGFTLLSIFLALSTFLRS